MTTPCGSPLQSVFGKATCVPAGGRLVEDTNDFYYDSEGRFATENIVGLLREQDATLAQLTRRINDLERSIRSDLDRMDGRIRERWETSVRQASHESSATRADPTTDVRVDFDAEWPMNGIHLECCRDRPCPPMMSNHSSGRRPNDLDANALRSSSRLSQGRQEFCTTKGCWIHGKGNSATNISSIATPELAPADNEASYKEIAPEGDCQPFKLSNSIWTASFFIGHRSIGAAASGLLLFLLVLNTMAQATFVGVTASRLTEHTFTAEHILGLERWRQNVGHNVQYYDRVSDKSLVAKVCSMDQTLPVEISDNKASLIESIDSFLPTQDPFGVMFSGPALCIVAVLCWSLRALGELHDIFEMFMSLRSIPWEGQSKILPNADGTVFYFAAICTPRRVWIVFILVVRLAICLSLWRYGSLFLINYSIEPADLVLNAVALEIVLNIDEGVFVMAPSAVKALFENLAPLPRAPRMTWKGLDASSLVLSTLMVAWILGHFLYLILPQVDRVSDAKSTLCDGDTDFIYAVDPFYFVYSAATGNSATEQTIALFRQAVSELIFPDQVGIRNVSSTLSGNFPAAVQAVGETVANLQLRPSYTHEESLAALQAMYWGAEGCYDILSLGVIVTMQELAKKFGISETPRDCSALATLCLNSTQVVATCPVTCGCNLPISQLFMSSAEYGCPAQCLDDTSLWEVVEELPCEEATPAELRKTDFWPSWADQFNVQANINFGRYPTQLHFVCGSDGDCSNLMLEMGCGFITYWNTALSYLTQYDGLDLCHGTLKPGESLLKPLGPVCPITCGCVNATETEAKEKRCPGTCPSA